MSDLMPQDDPHGFGSHLKILRFVLALVKPERVLELGSGYYSTPEFLKCDSVKELVSIESDEEWADTIQSQIDDDRFLLAVLDDVKDGIPDDLSLVDLIFVDNGQSVHERVQGIEAVLSQPHPVTVIHDAEYPDYQLAINRLAENKIVFDHPQHHTAVCW